MLEQFRHRLNRIPRRWKSLILVAFDAVALVAVLLLSYQLRLAGNFEPTPSQWVLILLAPVVALPIFLRFGLYRAVIRYLPERAIWTIVGAMMLATLAWVFVLFIAEVTRMSVLPRTVPIFYFLLGSVVVAGSRFAAKYILYPQRRGSAANAIVVYGAGGGGRRRAGARAGRGGGGGGAGRGGGRGRRGRGGAGGRGGPPAGRPAL